MKKKTVKYKRTMSMFSMYGVIISVCMGYYLYFIAILLMTQY